MPKIYSEFRIPFRQASDESQQTAKSVVLRTIGIALGILGTATGIYLIYSGLFASATIVGTVAVILSSFLLFLAIFRGQYIAKGEIQITKENQDSIVNPPSSFIMGKKPFSQNQEIQKNLERNDNERLSLNIENHQELPPPSHPSVNVQGNSPQVILPNTPPSSETTGVNNQVISPQAGKSDIEKLAVYLIGQIFSHLDLQELGRGCSVSKTMRRKLKNKCNESVWNKAWLERWAFGAQKWARYFGNVGVEPRLPENIIDILNSPCPFFNNMSVRNTHILVLVPATVGGEALTLNKLGQLIENPRNNGHATHYRYYDEDVKDAQGDIGINQSYWVLMTKVVIPGSKSKTYAEQKELVRQQGQGNYTLPMALEAAVCILMEHVVSKNKPFGMAYTRCSEKVQGPHPVIETVQGLHPVFVGGFSSGGLVVNHFPCNYVNDSFGVGALRRF